MLSLTEQIIIDILTQEMALDDQRIWIKDQNKKIPPEKVMYITVGMADSLPMSAKYFMEQRLIPAPPNPDIVQEWEVQRVNMRENIQIDIMSRNQDAIRRRWEIIAALNSIFSVQQQEANSFRIHRLPMNFMDTSDAEGGSNINRYTITIPCFVWYKKERLLSSTGGDYYDKFDTRVDVEKTIGTPQGIIEFNISAEEATP